MNMWLMCAALLPLLKQVVNIIMSNLGLWFGSPVTLVYLKLERLDIIQFGILLYLGRVIVQQLV